MTNLVLAAFGLMFAGLALYVRSAIVEFNKDLRIIVEWLPEIKARLDALEARPHVTTTGDDAHDGD